MPRKSKSKLQGVSEPTAYKGYANPREATIENAQVAVKPEAFLILPKLSNGRVWIDKGAMPQTDLFTGKHWKDGSEMPLSRSSDQKGFYSNPEMSQLPDKYGGWHLPDDAKQNYRLAEEQRQRAQAAAFGPDIPPASSVLKPEGEATLADYFKRLAESVAAEKVQQLRRKGFTETEIAEYIKKERALAIEQALKNPEEGAARMDAVDAMRELVAPARSAVPVDAAVGEARLTTATRMGHPVRRRGRAVFGAASPSAIEGLGLTVKDSDVSSSEMSSSEKETSTPRVARMMRAKSEPGSVQASLETM